MSEDDDTADADDTDDVDAPGGDVDAVDDADDEVGGSASDVAPAEAFATLGHPIRLAVVTTLQERADAPLSFSTLYESVGADTSAQFNYHLGELVGHVLRRTDDGYVLTAAGERLARAVLAGQYTDAPTLAPFALDGACVACGASGADALEGSYDGAPFDVDCTACGERVLHVAVPPSLVRGRDPAAFVDAFDRWSRSQVRDATRGICPDCGGAVDAEILDETREESSLPVATRWECRVCTRRVVTSFGAIAAETPVVEAFHAERDTALDDRHYWEIPQFTAGDHTEVRSRDPLRVRVTFHCDGDACHVTLDADHDVVDHEIVDAETEPGGAD
jgi:hypothetical protein